MIIIIGIIYLLQLLVSQRLHGLHSRLHYLPVDPVNFHINSNLITIH